VSTPWTGPLVLTVLHTPAKLGSPRRSTNGSYDAEQTRRALSLWVLGWQRSRAAEGSFLFFICSWFHGLYIACPVWPFSVSGSHRYLNNITTSQPILSHHDLFINITAVSHTLVQEETIHTPRVLHNYNITTSAPCKHHHQSTIDSAKPHNGRHIIRLL
jgi:hypothetical protein